MDNPLDPVMAWFKTARDSLRMSQRTLEKDIPDAVVAKYVFYAKPLEECESLLDSAKDEIERVVVLSLTAIFERTLRDHLVQYPNNAMQSGDPTEVAVRTELTRNIEFWNFSSQVVEVFPNVSTDVKGNVKQIIQFRNWVAHGHSAGVAPPINLVPAKAYQQLTEFLTQAGIV
jgi:hypothetical protein